MSRRETVEEDQGETQGGREHMVKFLPFRGAQLEYVNLRCDSEHVIDVQKC